MRNLVRDLIIVAGGHIVAYAIIYWTFPFMVHLTA
jgi:hypothetical protein